MRERLDKFIKTEGLSPSRFAEIMGVQPSSISHILGGRNKPSYDFIEKFLLRFPKVNPDWLILGKGQIYRQPSGDFQINDSQRVEIPAKQPETKEVREIDSDYATDDIDLFSAQAENNGNTPERENIDSMQNDPISSPQQPKTTAYEKVAIPNNIINSDIERVVIFLKNKTFISYSPE